MSEYDICIVGAGLFGSAAAKHLSVGSKRICLIGPEEPKDDERNNREIFGCHYDEGRVTRVFDSLRASHILNGQAVSRYRDIEKESGINFYHPVGCLYVAPDGNKLIEAAKKELDNKELGLIDITDDVQKQFPYLRFKADENIIFESNQAGYINPRRLLEAQQTIALRQGCQIVKEVVEEVKETVLENGEIVMTVTTSSGRQITSSKVLLCTNTFTNFKKLLPNGLKAKVSCQRSQTLLVYVSNEDLEKLKDMPSILNEEDGFEVYLLPPIKYPNGKWGIKIGLFGYDNGTMESLDEIKNWFIQDADKNCREKIKTFFRQILPGVPIKETEDITCSFCNSPTNLPYIDMVSSHLAIAIAGNGNSAKSSDEVGRIAANLVNSGEWTSEISKEDFKIQWQS